MGGMHGMGAIQYEHDEPVFHARWEARVYALTRALRFADKNGNIDASRHAIEQLPPADYLRMSYYEKWLARAEAQARKLAADSAASKNPVLKADMVSSMIAKGSSARRDVSIKPAFAAGERVRARNINPPGHTRLPRYARGKLGRIARDQTREFVFAQLLRARRPFGQHEVSNFGRAVPHADFHILAQLDTELA